MNGVWGSCLSWGGDLRQRAERIRGSATCIPLHKTTQCYKVRHLKDLRSFVHHYVIEVHARHFSVPLSFQCVTYFDCGKSSKVTCTPRQVHPITHPLLPPTVLASAPVAIVAAAPFIWSMTSIIGPVITCSIISECTLSLRPILCTGTLMRLRARIILSTAACVCAVTRMVLP